MASVSDSISMRSGSMRSGMESLLDSVSISSSTSTASSFLEIDVPFRFAEGDVQFDPDVGELMDGVPCLAEKSNASRL